MTAHQTGKPEPAPGEPLLSGLVDPRRVLIFRAVAHYGSLSAAARALGWTQPAIGQHLRRLERDVAQPLVVRMSNGVRLTDAGNALLRHADALAARLAVAENELAALADLRAGRLRIAAFPSAAAMLAPRLMTEMTRRHPGVDVRLIEVEPPQATRLVRTGDCDLALIFDYDESATTDADLSAHPVQLDPVYAVLPAGHSLADAPDVDLSELSSERWIAGCPQCRDHLLRAAGRAGFTPDIRHDTDDYVVAQNLVAAGLAVALLPQLALDAHNHPGVSQVALRNHLARTVTALTVADAGDLPAIRVAMRILRGQMTI